MKWYSWAAIGLATFCLVFDARAMVLNAWNGTHSDGAFRRAPWNALCCLCWLVIIFAVIGAAS